MTSLTASPAFTVPPFSGKNYVKNSDHVGDAWPCAICGKATVNASVWAVVCEGGARWCDSEEPGDCRHGGHMGSFPIGADCARRYRNRLSEGASG